MRLANKKILVTGAVSNGIGRAIAIACAREGADLALHYFDEEGVDDLIDTIQSLGRRAAGFRADFSSPSSARECVCASATFLGGLDVLFANAAMSQRKPFLAVDDAQFARTMSVNLHGTFACAQEAAFAMQDRGGSIVLVSSINDDRVTLNQSPYVASKGGIRQLGRSMAVELGPHNIRVNLLCPGAIETELNRDALADPVQRRALESRIPLGRVGQSQDLTGAAIFFASDESSYVTGASIVIDGGLALYPTQAPPLA